MNWALAGGSITGGSVLLLLALLAVRLLRYRSALLPESSAEMDTEAFSTEKYEPMARLAATDDLAFLSSLPGYRRAIGSKLRRERNRIFRMYLQELAGDFRGLHAMARARVADSPEADAEPVRKLIRQRVTFWRAIAAIELRLLLPWAGLPNVDIGGLVRSMEAMRLQSARISQPVLP